MKHFDGLMAISSHRGYESVVSEKHGVGERFAERSDESPGREGFGDVRSSHRLLEEEGIVQMRPPAPR
jgi:hypothetical protein